MTIKPIYMTVADMREAFGTVLSDAGFDYLGQDRYHHPQHGIATVDDCYCYVATERFDDSGDLLAWLQERGNLC